MTHFIAERISSFKTHSSSPVDVPGLAGYVSEAGPILVSFGACLRNSDPSAYARLLLLVNGSVEGQIILNCAFYETASKEALVILSGPAVLKLQLHAIGGGEAELYAEEQTQSSRDRAILMARPA